MSGFIKAGGAFGVAVFGIILAVYAFRANPEKRINPLFFAGVSFFLLGVVSYVMVA